MVAAQFIILSCYTGCTVVEVTNPQVFTSQGNHRAGTKTKALRAKNSGFDYVQTGFQTTIGLYPYFMAQAILNQCLLCFRQTQLERTTGIFY